ncbi:DUF397 domain-containing protein [Streptomyces sp. YIM 98790]|uniref:DUF397 domain-containing protein n=1 Tax=Streptomyces sp. YIM 98790 TaxID=2689077 RepID=UPI00140A902D|nr:DUF397 domain-containing protein [Streptomyces sp. YIM 98790]
MSAPRWLKSSYSEEGGNNNCVEVARLEGQHLALRESTAPQHIVVTTQRRFGALLDYARLEALRRLGW